jgi:hypothetical protein
MMSQEVFWMVMPPRPKDIDCGGNCGYKVIELMKRCEKERKSFKDPH